ncbi:BON domain-containing protein [Geothrix sp. 21YS21S-4]|uniref:BON domain-containing protein n=1 Tax=Geothrix sp. 21YS21S-4 TaxID=3068889 RepID=UPI0027B996B4|nr:BON domain-containing protein [Geothrix sp. 21YS21S-4]
MRHFKLNPHAALMASVSLILAGGSALHASDLDDRIERSARSSYNFTTYLKNDAIKIASSDGVVTLSGTVSQESHKYLAQETVAGLPGVKSVNNSLMVSGDQPREHSDGWITTKVKTILAFHRNVSATATEVNTQNGVVTLTGKADSESQKQLTSEYAKDVDGVTEVRNKLVVAKPAHRSLGEKVDDTSITAQVKTTLLFHKSTHMLATKVATKDGVVTLHGEARNGAERDLVTKLAEDVHGVKHVNNRMSVK